MRAVAIISIVLLLNVPEIGSGAPPVARPDSAAFRHVPDVGRAGDLVPSRAVLAAAVKEPFFAMVLGFVAADSLGTWTAADVTDFAADWGRPSDFPLDALVSFSREAIPAAEAAHHEDLVSDRRLVIRLRNARFSFSMPYSIMGYHPGSLVLASPLVFDEWHLGDRAIRITSGDATRHSVLRAITVFQVTRGFLVLDVDAWLDALLGDVADDAWTLGFAVAWYGDRLLGIGNSAGRNGRRIFGELDFQTDEIANHGQPAAAGLSRATRSWMSPARGRGPLPWRGY